MISFSHGALVSVIYLNDSHFWLISSRVEPFDTTEYTLPASTESMCVGAAERHVVADHFLRIPIHIIILQCSKISSQELQSLLKHCGWWQVFSSHMSSVYITCVCYLGPSEFLPDPSPFIQDPYSSLIKSSLSMTLCQWEAQVPKSDIWRAILAWAKCT